VIELPPPSCPSPDLIRGLSRASTSYTARLGRQNVDGRDKPGYDSGDSLMRAEPALNRYSAILSFADRQGQMVLNEKRGRHGNACKIQHVCVVRKQQHLA